MPLTRRLILQKARHHPTVKALTDCQHTVSGTISLPSRGTFHHSLTVLNPLSVTLSIQAYRVVPADSQQIPRARCYSGKHISATHDDSRTGLSPTPAGHSKPLPLHHAQKRRQADRPITHAPTTPHTQTLPSITRMQFSHSSAFVRHY